MGIDDSTRAYDAPRAGDHPANDGVPSADRADPRAGATSPAPATASRPGRTRVSRSTRLQQAIKDLIVQRGLVAGDAMPTELELVEQLDVSRNSLREALKALQAVGIVEIRHGFGMYVGHISFDALVSELAFHSRITIGTDHRDLANVIYLREVLESGLVRRLIHEHPDADHSAVADVITDMEAEARVGEVSGETDRSFHQVLYRPLGNVLVAQLLGAFWDVYFQLKEDIGPSPEAAADVVARHRNIYTAVVNKDADAAQEAMTAHFDGVRLRLDALNNGVPVSAESPTAS